MLFPNKVKYRKWQKTRRNENKKYVATRGNHIDFGSYALKATTGERITSNQIEAARKAMIRTLGKTAKVWIRIFPDRPFTQKPAEVKMGKGKGDVQGYQVEVFPGRIIFEVDGVDQEVAQEALRKAGTKLPLNTKFISRN